MTRKIVVIGGGTGPTAFLSGLVAAGGKKEFDITSIVSMADSGGSSGKLRDEKGVLPPGDILKSLLALSTVPYAREFLQFRFQDDDIPKLNGHSMGNIFVVAVWEQVGYLVGIRVMEKYLKCQGRVLPVTLDNSILVAETTKRRIIGEGEIEKMLFGRSAAEIDERVKSVMLVDPAPSILPEADEAIRHADTIVIGPGSFFTSLMAVLSVDGIIASLKATRANLVYVVNLTTNPRETPGWKASTFIENLESKIRRRVHVAVINKHLPPGLKEEYVEQKSDPVRVDVKAPVWKGRKIIVEDFVRLDSKLARHDPQLLTEAILNLR